jgi:nucleoid-associated protein YgaU
MARYENTKLKKEQVLRGIDRPKTYNITSYKTTIYSSVPETDQDIYVITQDGDRLDTLAHQFYGDSNLWWYLAKTNNLTFITIPVGTSLRIPGTTQYAIGK